MKQTPINKMREWILNYDGILTAQVVYDKATELLAEELDVAIGLLEWMNKVTYDTPMRLETDNDDIVDQYFTETYGGGYE